MNLESQKIEQRSPEEERRPKEPWEMSYAEFVYEYERVMRAVSTKEKKGKLDPDSQPYELISKEEQILLEKDWKAFSRNRGFSDEDIKEYERWLTLSGQRDHLSGAVNDPWRRSRFDYDKQIYLREIEKALADGRDVSPDILEQYNELKKPKEWASRDVVDVPSPDGGHETGEDVW